MKGPKTLLAEAIASALDEFFVVDQSAMETNLLADAAVKLHNTELKPRDNIMVGTNVTASVRGIVRYVAFEWHWGKSNKDGGSDLVKDVTLTLQGLEFTVSLNEGAEDTIHSPQDTPQDQPSTTSPTGSSFLSYGYTYVQDQLERIMDTLTLAVKDVVLTIELPDGSKLQVGGHGLEISSLGRRQVGMPLLQDFDIQRLYAHVHLAEESYPLLEDISYKAKTERTFGSRFLSRLDRGAIVMGESSDNGIVIHAGEPQIQVLSHLVDLLLVREEAQSSCAIIPTITESDDGSFEVEKEQQGDSLSDPSTPTSSTEPEQVGLPTYIQLPLAGVSLILPNLAKISLSNIVLKYQMDGTLFSIEGKQGIAVDDYPFFALGETTIWIADLVTSQFRVEDSAAEEMQDDDVVAYLRATSSDLSKLSGGVMEALGIQQRLMDATPEKRHRRPSQPQQQSTLSTTSWTVHLPGKVGCLWEQEGSSDIEFTVCHMEVELGTMTVKVASLEKFQYPDFLYLAEPIENMTFVYDGSSVSADLQDVVVVLAPQKETSESNKKELDHAASSMDSADGSAGYALPMGLHLTVSKFLAFKPDAKSVHTTLEKLELKLDPVANEDDPDDDKTCVTMSVRELNHDMMRLQDPVLSATFVLFSDWEVLSLFSFGAKSVYVATGYSLGDWKALLPKKGVKQIEKKRMKLPFAQVDKLKVIAMVKGVIGVKDSVLQVDPFLGTSKTTSDDMIQFYSRKVTSQIPGMIADTQVLGTNVGDAVVSNYGATVFGNFVGGAGMGGLLSVAAFDGVRNTIKEGKVSRGVEETDEWRYSDIARGLQHAAVRATREGAAKRGKGADDTGDPIDWAIGAGADATKYADENKARLAGAGAGAMGFGYGLAFGGPVGAVIGTLVASVATQKTVETIEDATKKKGVGEGTYAVLDINPSPKDLHANEILFAGILLKRRDFVKWDWRSHYFILTRGSLKYYLISDKPPKGHLGGKNEVYIDSSKGPRKSLDFVNHYIGNDGSMTKPKDNLFVFTIHSLEQAEPLWVLAAQTEDARSQWVSKISEAMASHNDLRSSKVGLRSSANMPASKRESIKQSLPPDLRDLVDF